jgi:N-acyl-D-amino-acid deacylase
VDVPELASYDQLILGLMKKYHMPGAAVAVVRGSKLIYAHGFGWADVEKRTPMQPDALFRIASVSKPITAVAIMKLVEQKKLTLDDKVWPLLDDLPEAPGANPDPRWRMITIRHLLNHSAGWDREKSGDPMFKAIDPRTGFRQKPPSEETIIRAMKSMRLDFTPGTRHAYSNFGYAILGHVIARVSGMSYEKYVKQMVLAPAGIERMELGRSRLRDRLHDEVTYYFPNKPRDYPMMKSVFAGEADVPHAYGGFYLESMAAHGGWVASTVDLLRFVNVVDGRPAVPDILSTVSRNAMLFHDTKAYPERDVWYGAG